MHDLVIFVSGKKSSNGRMLYDVCKSENQKSHSEIILGLPSDSKQKHYESLRFGVDNKVNSLRMFQAMMLVGTEMASEVYRKKYDLKTMFRTIPGCLGNYKIFDKEYSVAEIEEIIIAIDIPIAKYKFLCSFIIFLLIFLEQDHNHDFPRDDILIS